MINSCKTSMPYSYISHVLPKIRKNRFTLFHIDGENRGKSGKISLCSVAIREDKSAGQSANYVSKFGNNRKTGGQGVAGSNPVHPTLKTAGQQGYFVGLLSLFPKIHNVLFHIVSHLTGVWGTIGDSFTSIFHCKKSH